MSSWAASATEIIVAAASDLAPVSDALSVGFKEVSGNRVRFVLGSSGLLARQIDQGAPYDVFLSANEQYVKDLASRGRLVEDTVQVYALGRIALIGRKQLSELTASDVRHIAIANPAHAPYGIAARQALGSMWPALQSKIVYAENVRQALQFVESRNAEAGIVAWSLVMGRGVLLSDQLHAPIRQAGAVVTVSKHQAAARAFLDFLCIDRGRPILEKGGFSLPR